MASFLKVVVSVGAVNVDTTFNVGVDRNGPEQEIPREQASVVTPHGPDQDVGTFEVGCLI